MSKNIRGSKRKAKRVAVGEPDVGKGEALYYIFLWSMLIPLFTAIIASTIATCGIGGIMGISIVVFSVLGCVVYLFLKDQ